MTYLRKIILDSPFFVRSNKIRPLGRFLGKRMKLKLMPFSEESSVVGRFRRFLVVRMILQLSDKNYINSVVMRTKLDREDNS